MALRHCRCASACPSVLTTVATAGLGLGGIALLGVGLAARRDVARTLARERITGANGQPLRAAGDARRLAEHIRTSTLDSTEGRTYSETPTYVDAHGNPTADSAQAVVDERTGAPVRNPEADLWIQSTALQSALMQAYLAFRLSELTAGLGAGALLVGAGLSAAACRR